MPQPQVSKHLAVLRSAELVRVRPEGKWRYYSVDGPSLQELAQWLEKFSATVNQRLDRLEDVVADIEEGSA
jgi:DNA-binding transcriptional ArsR family regulator